MALLIPDNLRTRRDVPTGVNRLARALESGLGDGATVWFEPLFAVGGERPDVVVLVPDAGVLVIEVLEAKAGSVLGCEDGGLVVVAADGTRRVVHDPLANAAAFANALADAIATSPRLTAGERLPVSHAAAFPFLSRAEAEAKRLDACVADAHQCLWRDDLEHGASAGSDFARIVARLLDAPLRDPLSDDAETVHRALIHPDTVIAGEQLSLGGMASLADADEELRVLDREQESLAKTLGAGHRVIRGEAGSGKTIVLTYRAKLLAENFPKQHVLVTCFTRSLRSRLESELRFPNVDVRTLDDLMRRARVAAGTDPERYSDHPREELAALAVSALAAKPKSVPRYDHVLIDEAQDFPTDALRFAVSLLREGSDSLLVAADPLQNIFRTKFTWKAAGINATGRTRWLHQSYRNTREILEYAHRFLVAGGEVSVADDPDADDAAATRQPLFSSRSGPLPTVLDGGTRQGEVAMIARHCRSLVDAGVQPGDIAILYGARWTGGFHWPDAIVDVLGREGLTVFWATDPDRRTNRDRIGQDRSAIVLSTIAAAKGLEFRHVVLCGYLDDKPPADSMITRSLVYVGMTRATHELVLTASGKHPYLADLERF